MVNGDRFYSLFIIFPFSSLTKVMDSGRVVCGSVEEGEGEEEEAVTVIFHNTMEKNT